MFKGSYLGSVGRFAESQFPPGGVRYGAGALQGGRGGVAPAAVVLHPGRPAGQAGAAHREASAVIWSVVAAVSLLTAAGEVQLLADLTKQSLRARRMRLWEGFLHVPQLWPENQTRRLKYRPSPIPQPSDAQYRWLIQTFRFYSYKMWLFWEIKIKPPYLCKRPPRKSNVYLQTTRPALHH